MHVLYLIHQFYPNHYSGTERVIFGTASYMQKLGYKVTVLTYSYEPDEAYQHKMDEILYKEYIFEGLSVIAVKSNDIAYNNSYFIENESSVHKHIIKKINPDIIHVGHLMYMNAFLKAGKKINIPYVLSLTDFWFICHKAQMLVDNGALCDGPKEGKQCQKMCTGLEKEYYEKRFKQASQILEESCANIVSSKFLHNMMTHSLESFKSINIPYGLNFSYLDVNNSIYNNNSKINFLYSGTLSKHKGIDTVVKAFKSLENQNFILNIYGDGPLREYVIEEIKNENNINFFGSYSKEDTKKLIKENDVVLIPSAWYENNPIILQEMIAANLPPVVSNIGSLPEMVEDEKTGFVFKMSNVNDLRKVVEQIIDNPVKLNKIKTNMYKNYQVITIEQQCLAYRDIYLNALGKNK
ncbi:glycosyltransferase [Sulfurimonas aquatica]|uniref:Glycosyltransferase n=1 Tax=Sulfurimonas aquatica TaxID=2672570 RepID=A0A975GBQ2_9BACT|nr:glycosyltransferase [Sulfurimonas aquatica]QSZ40926.1 glycosyltransferase [Sulfurimonas aquatica]